MMLKFGWKFLLISSLCLSNFYNVLAQNPNVKSVEFKNAKLIDDPENLQVQKADYKEYDASGRMVKHIAHQINPGGELMKMSEVNHAWNDIGKYDEVFKYDEMGDLIRIEKVQFNSQNQKVKEEYIEPLTDPNTTYIKEYTYTDFDEPLKIIVSIKDGKVVGEENWKYNKDEEEIKYNKWELFPGKSKFEEEKKTTYTKDGFLDKAEKTTKDGKDTYKEITIFDGYKVAETIKYKNGEVISQFGGAQTAFAGGGFGGGTGDNPTQGQTLMTFGDFGDDSGDGGFGGGSGGFGGGGFGSFEMMAFDEEEETDDQGRVTKRTEYDAYGEISQIVEFEYDANGNTIREKKTGFAAGEETFSEEEITEYDEYNNLIRKASYSNGYMMTEDKYAYTYYQ